MKQSVAVLFGLALVTIMVFWANDRRNDSAAKNIATLSHSAGVSAADCSSEGFVAVADYDCTLTSWNARTGQQISSWQLCTDAIGSDIINVLHYSPKGDYVPCHNSMDRSRV
jgi:WD40 repeat protein